MMLRAIEKLDAIIQELERVKVEEMSKENLLFGVEIACRNERVSTLEGVLSLLQESRGELALESGVRPADEMGLQVGDVWLVRLEGAGPYLTALALEEITQFAVRVKYARREDIYPDNHSFWLLIEEAVWVERLSTEVDNNG